MLVQWRYKVKKRFSTCGGNVYCKRKYLESRDNRFPLGTPFLYKPSRKRYDYVDYTGRVCKCGVEASEVTQFLEFLGYIKFVEKKDEQRLT
jgi:hypothetical protein